jgi:peptide/nickel transport system ATP-binding protein
VNADPAVPLVRVTKLQHLFKLRGFHLGARPVVKAVDDVSFDIRKGEILALVGESGCGKTTIARCLVGLYTPTSGTIEFGGHDIAALHGKRRRDLFSRRVQMVFQDPYASLNPRWRVSSIIAEPIRAYGLTAARMASQQRVDQLLERVGLDVSDGRKFAREFSGGQRQRISIARALAGEPEFLVCDEPTSALDVSIQARILNLLLDLRQSLGLTYLLITHNLGTAYQVADRIAVVHQGQICEIGTPEEIFVRPSHAHTRHLLESVPRIRR